MQRESPDKRRVPPEEEKKNHEMSRVKEKEKESQGKNCCRSLWMDLSNLTVRIRRGLERDKERDYNQKEPVAEPLVRKHLKACYEVDTVEKKEKV